MPWKLALKSESFAKHRRENLLMVRRCEKVKNEKHAEQEISSESQDEEQMEMDDLLLKVHKSMSSCIRRKCSETTTKQVRPSPSADIYPATLWHGRCFKIKSRRMRNARGLLWQDHTKWNGLALSYCVLTPEEAAVAFHGFQKNDKSAFLPIQPFVITV